MPVQFPGIVRLQRKLSRGPVRETGGKIAETEQEFRPSSHHRTEEGKVSRHPFIIRVQKSYHWPSGFPNTPIARAAGSPVCLLDVSNPVAILPNDLTRIIC